MISESPEECIFRLEDYTEFRTSPEDKRLVLMNNWNITNSGYIHGAGKSLYLDRLICKSDYDVDHKDTDKMNNRRDNLRPATRSQNSANSNVRVNNKLNLKGVSLHQGRFRALLYKDGKRLDLGCYDTPE